MLNMKQLKILNNKFKRMSNITINILWKAIIKRTGMGNVLYLNGLLLHRESLRRHKDSQSFNPDFNSVFPCDSSVRLSASSY